MNNPKLENYLNGEDNTPCFLVGDSLELLKGFPDKSIDCIVTSPPYWGQRNYQSGGIGLESTHTLYVEDLLKIVNELYRVLKDTGSFWLNLGDTYGDKSLLGIPWRVALKMTDEQNWTLRNSVIWNKHKGGLNPSKDRLRNIHEMMFHFVKKPKGYYYNADLIRSKPRKAIVRNGSIISATGVSGVRYKRQIELSTSLTEQEKINARAKLDSVLNRVSQGEISDFRMIIRNQQRTTHSDSENISGRARDLKEHGFYFLFYHPNGTLPGDVWDIIPEDTQKRVGHYAAYPEELCMLPIMATCPPNGVVLDPFCGTGTTNKVALSHNVKSIGLDMSIEYINIALQRLNNE